MEPVEPVVESKPLKPTLATLAPKRKLKTLNIDEKYQLIKEVESGTRKKDVAFKFGIVPTTLSTILKNKTVIIDAVESGVDSSSKRQRKPMFGKLDKAVFEWFKATRAQNLPISGKLIKDKAREFSLELQEPDFKASTGWLDKFKKRYSISFKEQLDEMDYTKWRKDVLPFMLQRYEPKDIYSATETGLFFQCLPDSTQHFKNERCFGGKFSKQRITLMLCANMDGSDKLRPLMIGRRAQPHCLRGIRWLPVEYRANPKALMTGEIFEEWVLNLDAKFDKSGRNILLFVDHCPAHPKEIQQKLKYIELVFFPSNMTTELQPLKQGVIHNLKCHYRRRILNKSLGIVGEAKKCINLMDCVDAINKAWTMDVTAKTIESCFMKAGIGEFSEWVDEANMPLVILTDRNQDELLLQIQYDAWRCHKNVEVASFEDFIHIDDDLITSEFPTDQDIIQQVKAGSYVYHEEEADLDYPAFPPNQQTVLHSFHALRTFLQFNPHTDDTVYSCLNTLENFFEMHPPPPQFNQ